MTTTRLVASAMRVREPRRKVLLQARMKSEAGWHDKCIVDLSKRGAGLRTAAPPPRGAYVEIRRGLHVIIARVVWTRQNSFGVAAQEELPVESIAANRAPASNINDVPAIERRRLPRNVPRPDQNCRSGQRLQYVAAALSGMVAAMIAGAEVREALAEPLDIVGAALTAR